MLMFYLAMAIALFFAMNIGASGTAASMGAAYGSDAISKRWAMILVSIGALAGAVLGGGAVVKTISGGIIPATILDVNLVVIILTSATLTLFIANLMGIPLSTSEVTVGAIVGVGIAYQEVYLQKLLFIMSFWLIVPIVSFIGAFLLSKAIRKIEARWPVLKGKGKWKKWLSLLLIVTGFYEAFSAGMNNVANAVGPLVGAGLLSETRSVWIGGFFVALGALLLGGRVLETNGKKITRLSLLQGSAVSLTSGTLVVVASIMGIPVPLTQATTSAILGVGTSDHGFRLWQKGVIKKIMKVWIVSPVSSLVVSFVLIHVALKPDPYIITVIISVLIATVGSISLSQAIRRENRSYNDQGGGI
ncbi:sulfate permease [Ammoniphilus oxalaticus]|uniref:Sulfate permease n=1 Tax=Ammoniphilus oxalaticus TaxID=66863 RepID=A0A419SQG3_9BACL|nr:inorganic phosphate transporter [Ammoniphilus oxalaticus]RKD26730.1 sulfate permease [Ammoniphilus oxalaticus]